MVLRLCLLMTAAFAVTAPEAFPADHASATDQAAPSLQLHTSAYVAEPDRARLLAEYERRIRDLDYDYRAVGSVAEALAFALLEEIYPEEHFVILRGINYQDQEGRTLGELDLVVLDRYLAEVVLVAESKVSGEMRRAASRAAAQLDRFRYHLEEGAITGFSSRYPGGPSLAPTQFLGSTRYVRIGGRGALGAGCDYELDLTREEIDELQSRLLAGHGAAGSPPP